MSSKQTYPQDKVERKASMFVPSARKQPSLYCVLWQVLQARQLTPGNDINLVSDRLSIHLINRDVHKQQVWKIVKHWSNWSNTKMFCKNLWRVLHLLQISPPPPPHPGDVSFIVVYHLTLHPTLCSLIFVGVSEVVSIYSTFIIVSPHLPTLALGNAVLARLLSYHISVIINLIS